MPLKRVKYVSRFSQPMSAEQIQQLADKAARHNQANDITGVLMTTGGLFFQVIEGPPEAIDALFARIAADRRHVDVLMLAEETAENRMFSGWWMNAVNLDAAAWKRAEPLRELLYAMLLQRDALASLSTFAERALWDEIRRS